MYQAVYVNAPLIIDREKREFVSDKMNIRFSLDSVIYFVETHGEYHEVRLMSQFSGMRCRFRTADINEIAKVTVVLESVGVSCFEDLGPNLMQAQRDVQWRNKYLPVVQGTTVFAGGSIGV